MPEKITIAINGIAKKIAISNVIVFMFLKFKALHLALHFQR
jgi:hypothetical protein